MLSPKFASESYESSIPRRGRANDAMGTHRNMLLTGGENLSAKQQARLQTLFDTADPNREIAAAWACKERLRALLPSGNDLEKRKPRLTEFLASLRKRRHGRD